MTRRLLILLALLLLPGAVVLYGIVAAVKWLFRSEADLLSDETVRRIRRDSERAARMRELEDARVITRPSVIDGPPSTALWRVRGER